jgi:membrane protein DedA with SNARE-associated domain
MPAMTLQTLGATLLLDVGRYGYAALAAGVLLENAGLPIPGETMLLTAAALAARGRLSIVLVALVAMIAAITGDNIGFAIGRLGGRPLLERFGRWVFVTPERLDAMDRFFGERGPFAVFIARFIPALRVVAAVAAGSSSIRWRTFLLFNALGAITWATVVSVIGFTGTDIVTAALPWLRTAHLGAWGLLAVAAIALLAHAAFEAVHERRIRTAARDGRRG